MPAFLRFSVFPTCRYCMCFFIFNYCVIWLLFGCVMYFSCILLAFDLLTKLLTYLPVANICPLIGDSHILRIRALRF